VLLSQPNRYWSTPEDTKEVREYFSNRHSRKIFERRESCPKKVKWRIERKKEKLRSAGEGVKVERSSENSLNSQYLVF